MVLILAFSLQDQVEKYGAYVGLAAFLGLAVLSLLYFAQARELKRLRDWAGRAPERAQELEARVVAQAEEALASDAVPERSGTVGPAVPVAQPASGNGRQAGTPAPIPMGPRPAVALAAQAAPQATVEAPAVPATGDDEAGEAGDDRAAAPGGDGAAEPGDDRAVAAGEAAPPADEPAPVGDETQVHDVEAEEGPEEPEPEPVRSGNGVPAQPPTEIPRATPRPQPRSVPKPVPAAPLRAAAPSRSTTLPPRRTARRPRRAAGSSRAGL
jgi:hypothetical protein